MNTFIEKKAIQFIRHRVERGIGDIKRAKNELNNLVYQIDSEKDRSTILNMVYEANLAAYNEHLEHCKSPNTCTTNLEHEELDYYLSQELKKLGQMYNSDDFTFEERIIADSKIDQILKDLEEIKTGQEVIYEDLRQEIEELKNLYSLGKKNWRQLLRGKLGEMVLAGVISESVSKNLVNIIQDEVVRMIGQ